MKNRITIVRYNGMTNIDSDVFSVSYIDGLYATGDGIGIQTNDETRERQLQKITNKIQKALIEIEYLYAEEN